MTNCTRRLIKPTHTDFGKIHQNHRLTIISNIYEIYKTYTMSTAP